MKVIFALWIQCPIEHRAKQGLTGLLVKEAIEKLLLAQTVVPKLMESRLRSRIPDRSGQAKNRRSPLIENLNTKKQKP